MRERFLCPPFSILDTATKEWQDRKKQWLSLGIKSDESRGNIKNSGGLAGNVPGYYDKKQKIEKRIGHKLTNTEFENNYLREFKTTLKNTEGGGILSIFDPVLAEVLYYWFSFPGAKVLDPFAGGSVRGIVASFLNQEYTGVDLREEQIKANYGNAGDIIHDDMKQPVWITGDSVNIKKLCPGEYDFVFSCPPYVDLEVYSDRPDDLSNMNWSDFLQSYRSIINSAVSMLKENRFAAFVVSECRDNKGIYYNFVSETIRAFIDAGACYYNELILKNTCGSVPIRASRNFMGARKIGRIHQNVLVFYKGDVKKIKSIYGEISIVEIEKEIEGN